MTNETPLNEIIQQFLKDGTANRPVYITEVRKTFDMHPDTVACELCSIPVSTDGEIESFSFRIPKAEHLSKESVQFTEEYLTAMMYNIVSVFGGSALIGCVGSADSDEAKIMRRAFKPFAPYDLITELETDGNRIHERPETISFLRSGAGRSLNVAERMAGTLGSNASTFKFGILDRGGYEPRITDFQNVRKSSEREGEHQRCSIGQAAESLACIEDHISAIGLDIGGSDIKIVLTLGNRIIAYREYDWFPTCFTETRQLVVPILMLVRWGRARAAAELLPDTEEREQLISELNSVSTCHDNDRELLIIEQVEQKFTAGIPSLHYIGLCFPDVVVKDKIVGGEVYKLRGIRASMQERFETDYRNLTNLDVLLSEYCVLNSHVAIINDGPMAAFTAAMESAFKEAGSDEQGIFAHTLGTELGTGWLKPDGSIPDIPLEVYNLIIDLGSRRGRLYDSDDPRSIRNFNTDLPGTLQKYTSQSGVFRLAMDTWEKHYPDLMKDLYDEGFLVRVGESVRIVSEPKDMRKPLLEHIMRMAEDHESEAAQEIFCELGRYLGITWLETEYLLHPETKKRVYFGRLVKMPRCFSLIEEGASEIVPDIELSVADDSLACSPFMQQLRDDKIYTVAQFAQAVGTAYYAMFTSQNRQ
jgi:hypothetical protein